MNRLDRFLLQHTRWVLLLLVPATTWILTLGGLLSKDAVPFGDGEHYALRALSLCGFLHSGQWGRFWDEFILSGQSLLPPHYLVFFLVPTGLASVALYGVIQVLVSCSLLAIGIYWLCEALERPAWSPALFLLCVMQNLTLDSAYFYFADTPFLAVVTISLAAQAWAWRRSDWRLSLLSGIGAALPFWVKPPNALIVLGIYVIAEVVRFIFDRIRGPKPPTVTSLDYFRYLRHWGFALISFIPLFGAALICGGFQSIIYLIDANQISGVYASHIDCTGLLRLFYFPACLTAYYQTELLLLIVFVAAVVTIWRVRNRPAPSEPHTLTPFPVGLLLPFLVAYGVFGFYFSFGMADKVIRSLLVILPIFWLGIFYLLDRCQFRASLLFLVTMVYSIFASLQVAYGPFNGAPFTTSDYQLSDDWLARFPPMHTTVPAGAELTRNLFSAIRQAVPENNKIAVGTEQMFLTSESLTWIEQQDSALLGKEPAYDFNNFLTNQGKFSRPALLGSRGILLILHPKLQYSPQVAQASMALAQFAYQKWMLQDHLAQVFPLSDGRSGLLGVLIVLKEPMTDALVDQAISGTKGTELLDTLSFSGSHPKRLSLHECWEVLFPAKTEKIDK